MTSDLSHLVWLNNHEVRLNELQEQLNAARERFAAYGDLQLDLDRAQTSLDAQKKWCAQEKTRFVNPN